MESLKYVNDIAERKLSLILSFNSVLTNQDELKQYLLQGVEKLCQQYPDPNQKTFEIPKFLFIFVNIDRFTIIL